MPCSPLVTPLLGLFATSVAQQQAKAKGHQRERWGRGSVAVLVQACGSTTQFYSVQNTEKNNKNSPNEILKVIL